MKVWTAKIKSNRAAVSISFRNFLVLLLLMSGVGFSILTGPAEVSLAADSAPPVPVTAQQQKALDRINYYRSLAGVPPAHLNPALMLSATFHAAYVSQNGWYGNPHDEEAAKPGFTGTEMSDRATKFGYKGTVNEDMSSIGEPVAAIDGLMNTVSHRDPILEPAYTDIGYGFATGKNAVDVISFGSPNYNWNYNPPIVQWPPDNYLAFGTTFWGESPNPLTGVSFPIGNPVTLTYRGTGKMELVPEECQLLDQDGVKVDSVTGVGNTFTTRGSFILAARKPLAKNRGYSATMTYRLDGQKQTRTWSFNTGLVPIPSVPDSNLPASLQTAPPAITRLWLKVDGPVAGGKPGQTWLYGPEAKNQTEDYAEAPGGKRGVWYLDKARLEITRPSGDTTSEWYVTSGLLPRELITNKIQVGDNKFIDGPGPALVPVAGDLTGNPNAPTYATFRQIASLNNDRKAASRTGQIINEALGANGVIIPATNQTPVKYNYYDNNLGHNIAEVFVNYFKTLPSDWVYLVGLPLVEPYWTRVNVAGIEKDVLVQVFERRVLTFTPANNPEWQVEMGNVGLHYRVWRYNSFLAPRFEAGNVELLP